MKTAVSLPDDVFEAAEVVARRMRISRSELYRRAVATFVDAHRGEMTTERLNELHSDTPSEMDPVLAQMQLLSPGNETW